MSTTSTITSPYQRQLTVSDIEANTICVNFIVKCVRCPFIGSEVFRPCKIWPRCRDYLRHSVGPVWDSCISHPFVLLVPCTARDPHFCIFTVSAQVDLKVSRRTIYVWDFCSHSQISILLNNKTTFPDSCLCFACCFEIVCLCFRIFS
jgi:hypothetical protein